MHLKELDLMGVLQIPADTIPARTDNTGNMTSQLEEGKCY